MKLSVQYDFLAKRRSIRTGQVMDHFGIDFEIGPHVIVEEFDLPLEPGQIVCFNGDSGSGKSSLLREAAGKLPGVLDLDHLNWENRSLVDLLPVDFETALELLSACGLSEAQLLLRTPAELSEGQRYRFRLALAMAHQPQWIMADEFTATLDRTLAKVIAFNVRKMCDRRKIGFLLATTHADLLEDLQPDWHVLCDLKQAPQLTCRTEVNHDTEATTGRKKKASAFSTSYSSPRGLVRTGRISRGGIIAVTTSDL